MNFRTQYNKSDSDLFITESGNPEYIVYNADEDGNPVEAGIGNLYDEIQSHRESVELSVLLQRFAQGDETALNKVQGVYDDIVGAPSTYAELFDAVKNAESSFNGLPAGLREKFNNSPVEFWKAYGTPEFAQKVREFDGSQHKKTDNNVDNNNIDNNSNTFSGNGGVVNE